MDASTDNKINERTKNKNANKESASFIIKEKRNEEQIGVAKGNFFINKCKQKIGYGKKYPKICLGENKRKIFRERKNVVQPIHSMFYSALTIPLYFCRWKLPTPQLRHP